MVQLSILKNDQKGVFVLKYPQKNTIHQNYRQ